VSPYSLAKSETGGGIITDETGGGTENIEDLASSQGLHDSLQEYDEGATGVIMAAPPEVQVATAGKKDCGQTHDLTVESS